MRLKNFYFLKNAVFKQKMRVKYPKWRVESDSEIRFRFRAKNEGLIENDRKFFNIKNHLKRSFVSFFCCFESKYDFRIRVSALFWVFNPHFLFENGVFEKIKFWESHYFDFDLDKMVLRVTDQELPFALKTLIVWPPISLLICSHKKTVFRIFRVWNTILRI